MKIAELASQCFLATGLYRCPPPAILADLTVQMVKLQRNLLGRSNQATVEMLHTLVHHADLITSAHMYILCSALSQQEVTPAFSLSLSLSLLFSWLILILTDVFLLGLQLNADLKPFCIELYVRGAAVDLNDLENRKLRGDVDLVKSGEMALASTFSALADVVDANVRICRECVLTAFSLHPTKQRFERLTQLAAASVSGDPGAAAASPTADAVVVEHSRGAVVGEPPPGSGGGPGGGDPARGSFHLAFASVKKELEESESHFYRSVFKDPIRKCWIPAPVEVRAPLI